MAFPTKYPKALRDYVRNNVLTKTNDEIIEYIKRMWNVDYPKNTLNSIRAMKRGTVKRKFGSLKKPVGTERIDKDGYVLVVCEDGKEHPKQRIVWEKEHGKLEKDDVIIFLDGNRQNVVIENLFCLKRKYVGALSKMLQGLDPTTEMRKTAIFTSILYVEAKEKERLKQKKSNYSVPKKETYRIVCDMLNERCSLRQISEKLGISTSTVGLYKLKKRLGFYEER